MDELGSEQCYWHGSSSLDTSIHAGSAEQEGEYYPSNTLYSLVMGLQHQLRGAARCVNLLTDVRFFQARQVLDLEMRRLCGQGLGAKLKKAEPLTNVDEDVL